MTTFQSWPSYPMIGDYGVAHLTCAVLENSCTEIHLSIRSFDLIDVWLYTFPLPMYQCEISCHNGGTKSPCSLLGQWYSLDVFSRSNVVFHQRLGIDLEAGREEKQGQHSKVDCIITVQHGRRSPLIQCLILFLI